MSAEANDELQQVARDLAVQLSIDLGRMHDFLQELLSAGWTFSGSTAGPTAQRDPVTGVVTITAVTTTTLSKKMDLPEQAPAEVPPAQRNRVREFMG